MRKTTVTLGLALTGLLACAAPLNQSASSGVVAYSLDSIDERPLPYLQVEGSAVATHEITGGLLLLQSDGSFFMDVTYFVARASGPARVSRLFEGLWTRSGNTFTFEFDNGGRNSALLQNGGLEMEIEGTKFCWVR